MYRPLKKSFYERSPVIVARELIGSLLVFDHPQHGTLGGIVVETEAYGRGDAASHAWSLERKREKNPEATGRAIEFFGEPGLSYVYLNYGMYWMLNVVTEQVGVPGAVLIRAIEPTLGENIFWENRPKITKKEHLANGPGKLTLAMEIDSRYHQIDMTDGPIRFEKSNKDTAKIAIGTSSRIGITKSVELPWRFFVKGSPFVSPGKPS